MFGKPRAVVSNLNTKRAILLFRLNFDQTGCGARRNSVTNGILDNGWRMRLGTFASSLVAKIHSGHQSVLEADTFDLKVTTEIPSLVAG